MAKMRFVFSLLLLGSTLAAAKEDANFETTIRDTGESLRHRGQDMRRSHWEAQTRAFFEKISLTQNQKSLRTWKLDMFQAGVREKTALGVLKAYDYYYKNVEEKDWGTVRAYLMIVEGRSAYAVFTTTDGDDGWLEVFDIDGRSIGAARTDLDHVKWGPIEEVRKIDEALAQNRSFEFYQGVITLKTETHDFCFRLDTEVINPYEGDPDVRGNYSYQEIPSFEEKNSAEKKCVTRWNHNGQYIRSCSGLFLIYPAALKGDVFTTLSRFDPINGGLAVQPVGQFEMQRVASCSQTKGLMEDGL